MENYNELTDDELQKHIDAYAKLVASGIRKDENEEKLISLMMEQQKRDGMEIPEIDLEPPEEEIDDTAAEAVMTHESDYQNTGGFGRYVLYVFIVLIIYAAGMALGAAIALK